MQAAWCQGKRSSLTPCRGKYTLLVNLIGHAVEAGLDFYLEACVGVPDEYYQPLPDLARSRGCDPNYLGLLVRQAKLEARKRGGRWYATPAALERYEQQVREGRFQRGRPRRVVPRR